MNWLIWAVIGAGLLGTYYLPPRPWGWLVAVATVTVWIITSTVRGWTWETVISIMAAILILGTKWLVVRVNW